MQQTCNQLLNGPHCKGSQALFCTMNCSYALTPIICIYLFYKYRDLPLIRHIFIIGKLTEATHNVKPTKTGHIEIVDCFSRVGATGEFVEKKFISVY